MKMYVPRLGDRIRLTQDWEFEFEREGRNETLMQHMQGQLVVDMNSGPKHFRYTIPAGAVLKIERIYIRQGQRDFDSMTFTWEGTKIKGGKAPASWNPNYMRTFPSRTVRFWVKLDIANEIEFDNV